MIKLAVFDYDNTLVDTTELLYQSEKALLQEYCIELTQSIFYKYHDNLLRPDGIVMEHYIADFGIKTDHNKLLQKRYEKQLELISEHLHAMPGAKELLDYLQKKNIELAVVTNTQKEIFQKGLEILQIDGYFSHKLDSEDVHNGKPHPEIYEKILRHLNTKPEDAVAFDDALEGITSAQKAGIFCFAVPLHLWDFNLYDVDVIVKDLHHAKKLLQIIL